MVARQRINIGIAPRERQTIPYAVLADGEPGDYAFTVDGAGAICGMQIICPARQLHAISFGGDHRALAMGREYRGTDGHAFDCSRMPIAAECTSI